MRIKLIWITIIAAASAGLVDVEFGKTQSAARTFVIVTRYHGINASEIERIITNKLENTIAELPGIKSMHSSSEFSQSRVSITLDSHASPDDFYLLLRDRVDRVGAQWPDSVQRPQIHSFSGRDQPIFIAAFSTSQDRLPMLGNTVEKDIKLRIARVDGVGEVNTGGGGIQEIHVELEPDKSSHVGLTPGSVGKVLQDQHIRLPIGFLEENNRETELLINGQFKDLKAVENLLLHTGKTDRIPLNSTADVHYDFRKPEDISRLDGREMVTLYVHAAGDANIVQVAGDLRDEIARLKAEGYSINTVFDLGSRMEKSIGNVLISVFTGMASIAVFLFLALPSPGIILHLTLSLALIDIFTISLLSALSIPIDQAILAGMAVGTGMMIDGGLVITEAIQRRGYSFRTTAPPLIASTTTTLIVFIPLIRSASSSPAIVSLSLAIIFLLVFSLFYYLTFLPRFLSVPEKNSITEHRIMKPPRKLIVWCTHHPWAVLGTSSAIFTASLGCSFILPRDIDQNHEPGTLFAQLEMESGAALSSVDERNSAVVQVLTRQGTGILSVESRARVGQGQLTIRYDPEITSPMDITLRLEEAAAGVPGVFAYIPDGAAMEGTQVKFSLSGPDNGFLRKLAMEIADNSLTLPWVSSCVLHFKEDPPSYVFVPDTEILQQRLLNTRDIANFLQWGIQGPVALKWIQNGQERDLRVFLSRQNIENLSNLHDLTLNTGSGERVKLDQLGKWQLSKEPSTITHVNRQRAVDFSLITNKSNLTEVLALAEDFIMETPLPSGYGLFHDRSLEEKLGEYRSLGFSLILSLMLIFAVLSIQSESLRDPLIELSILPISLSLPIIIYTLTGQTLRSSTLIGLILLSGMSVNNSILILSCFRTSPDSGINAIVRAVCQRYRSLILTTGTTLLGTLPLLLFPGDGNYFTKDMALILALGLVGSFSASLTCYPALLTLFESKCKFIPQDGLLIRTK